MSSNYRLFPAIHRISFWQKITDPIDNFHNIPNIRKNPPLFCILQFIYK